MGTKNNPGNFDCYHNAMPDEPMFILLARDPNAPDLIERWADGRQCDIVRKVRPASDVGMVNEARDCARKMRKWRKANMGKWRK
jgi:hypothetical protein